VSAAEDTKRDVLPSRDSFGTFRSASASSSPLAPGYRLDRYELICPLAEGGMASVWIARQTGKHGFRKLVAIKTILPKYASEPKFQRMFVDEARIASRIEHGNVAQIIDVGEHHGITYLVMEYVDGDALSKISRAAQKKGQPVPHGVLLRVMADVCGGLHAAHELRDEKGQPLGVVHRDVSPQNVLVTTRGTAKLIDFGIAKARDRVAGDTNVDQLKGKVVYMAPEHAIGRPTDRRADVWAVGAVLYHLLAGKPPFQGDNDVQTLFLLASGRPPVPLPPSVHPAVAEVLKRALAHSPDVRFATAAQLQQALEDAMLKAGLVTTSTAVAAYLADLVPDRAERRQKVIGIGLKAADERDAVARVMQSNAETTGGHSEPGGGVTAPSLPESRPSSAGETLGPLMATTMNDRGRSWAIAVGAAVLAIAAIALIALLATGSSRSEATAGPATPVTGVAQSVAPPPAASPAASDVPAVPAEPPSAAAAATTSAPHVQAKPPPPRWVPPRPAAAPKPAPTTKPRVNDGF
jgi:serine/threonine-protein kinase